MTTTHEVSPIGASPGWVERRAKLFEAGDYPDKGISVTIDDLSALVQTFAGPVPLLIEHADSPLQLGFLTAVLQDGNELFGTVTLSREADALVRRSGARGLSLGLAPDLRSIREVSLVRNPRVASAGLFSGDLIPFSGEISPERPKQDHSVELGRLVREGRLVPAQVPLAEAIMSHEGVVEFSGDRRPMRELLIALLDRQQPLALFGQFAPAVPAVDRPSTMLPEEAAFYQRHFPGVPLSAIAEAKGA